MESKESFGDGANGDNGCGTKSLKACLPQKRFFRARAHSNPFSDSQFFVPLSPIDYDWSAHFPEFFAKKDISPDNLQVKFVDVGCGFGGLLVRLSTLFPNTLMVGMELRDKVSEYVKERIDALRLQYCEQYGNISLIRTNAMKYLPNYFFKGQLTKMFFLFPDPHFKEKNHRRRIITTALLTEYAYFLAAGGIIYTITDVEELGIWMNAHLASHPLFEKVSDEELEKDPVVELLECSSEEGQKVKRNGGMTYKAIYKRI